MIFEAMVSIFRKKPDPLSPSSPAPYPHHYVCIPMEGGTQGFICTPVYSHDRDGADHPAVGDEPHATGKEGEVSTLVETVNAVDAETVKDADGADHLALRDEAHETVKEGEVYPHAETVKDADVSDHPSLEDEAHATRKKGEVSPRAETVNVVDS